MTSRKKNWLSPLVLGIVGVLTWFLYWKLLIPSCLSFSDSAKFVEAQRLIFKMEKLETEAISTPTIAGLEKLKHRTKGDEVVVCISSGGNTPEDETVF